LLKNCVLSRELAYICRGIEFQAVGPEVERACLLGEFGVGSGNGEGVGAVGGGTCRLECSGISVNSVA